MKFFNLIMSASLIAIFALIAIAVTDNGISAEPMDEYVDDYPVYGADDTFSFSVALGYSYTWKSNISINNPSGITSMTLSGAPSGVSLLYTKPNNYYELQIAVWKEGVYSFDVVCKRSSGNFTDHIVLTIVYSGPTESATGLSSTYAYSSATAYAYCYLPSSGYSILEKGSSVTVGGLTYTVDGMSGSNCVKLAGSGTSIGTGTYSGSITCILVKNSSPVKYSLTVHLSVSERPTTYYAYLYYNANGGTGAPSTQSDSYSTTGSPGSTSFIIKTGEPTRADYIFAGWSTSSSASSAQYRAGDSITVYYNSSKTLYAVWEKTTINVTFNPQNGSPVTVVSVNMSDVVVFPTDPIKDAYVFSGWYTDSGCTTLYNITTSVTAPFTLYAGWAEGLYFSSEPSSASNVILVSTASTSIVCSATGSSKYSSISWDFGDGSKTTGLYAAHLYASPGTYTVTLTLENDFGSSVTTQEITVKDSAGGINPVSVAIVLTGVIIIIMVARRFI